MKTVSVFLLTLAATIAPASAAAPLWDASGNSQLNGNYYFRQVLYQADNTGAASGYCFMSSPVIQSAKVYFLLSKGILMGSETETSTNDMFIAAPVASLSAASFSGAYTISAFFPGATPASSADASYQLNPDAAGK